MAKRSRKLAPPVKDFVSEGGRRFTVMPGEHSERYSGDKLGSSSWAIMYKGEPAGKLFSDTNYRGKPWHATTRELYWKYASDAPTGIGFDVSAFVIAEETLQAWGHSADQILDWSEGKDVRNIYDKKGFSRRHQTNAGSGYTLCPCCGYDTVSNDEDEPELCSDCEEASCSPDGSEPRCEPEEGYQGNTGSNYWVWAVGRNNEPLTSEGPWGPYDYTAARQYARISASKGSHDRAVSVGKDPSAESFEIVRTYAKGTGEHKYGMAQRLGAPMNANGEYRDVWLCADCTIVAANDDPSGIDSDARVEEVYKGLRRLGNISANFDSESGEGIEEFTSQRCDSCGTRLAGERTRFAQWPQHQPNAGRTTTEAVREAIAQSKRSGGRTTKLFVTELEWAAAEQMLNNLAEGSQGQMDRVRDFWGGAGTGWKVRLARK